MRFLDVRTDFAFKRVFGSEQSKPVLIDFLNAVIDFGSERIADLTIVDPYQIPLLKGMKDSYVDVKAVLSDQRKVIIEMQVLNVEGFEQRVLYNAAKLYSTQLKQAERYASLEPIIALTITDFIMFPEIPKVISYWSLREREFLLKYSDDIELVFVELPKFSKTEEELEHIADKWIYFIKHAGEMNFIPQSFIEPHLLEAFEIANTAALSEEELEMQFKRHDFIRIQRGLLDKLEKLTKTEQKLANVEQELAGVEEELARTEEQRVKAEEELARAEEQRIKAEEELARAEEQRVKAEEELVRTEEQRVKAEEELARAEEQRIKAEEEALVQGIEQGIEQGIAKGIEEAARNMLRDNLPVDAVSKYTGLSMEVVERLRNDS